jgi:hypothetical protein
VLAAAILVVVLYRRRTCFFLACFAFINFLPASSLLFRIGTIMADRLLYLPSLGLLGCAVYWRSMRYAESKDPGCDIVADRRGICSPYLMRNRNWQSEFEAYLEAEPASPETPTIRRQLAELAAQ